MLDRHRRKVEILELQRRAPVPPVQQSLPAVEADAGGQRYLDGEALEPAAVGDLGGAVRDPRLAPRPAGFGLRMLADPDCPARRVAADDCFRQHPELRLIL